MKKIQQIYDDTVAHNDYGNTFEKIRCLIDFSGQNFKILDVGCSAGEVTKELTEKHHVYGIEISEQAAQKARENGLRVIVHDLNQGIPKEVQKERFDIILFNDILEHLIDVESTLHGFVNLLTPGGSVIISFPNYFSFSRRMRFFFGRSIVLDSHEPFKSWNYFHLRFLNFKDYLELARHCKLELMTLKYAWFTDAYMDDKTLHYLWRVIHYLTPVILKRWLMRLFPNLFLHAFIGKFYKHDEKMKTFNRVSSKDWVC